MSDTPPVQYDPVITAQTFFQRTEIKGAEVEAYVQAYNWLESLKIGELIVVPTPSLTALREQVEEQGKQVTKLQLKITRLKDQLAEQGAEEDMTNEGGPAVLDNTHEIPPAELEEV